MTKPIFRELSTVRRRFQRVLLFSLLKRGLPGVGTCAAILKIQKLLYSRIASPCWDASARAARWIVTLGLSKQHYVIVEMPWVMQGIAEKCVLGGAVAEKQGCFSPTGGEQLFLITFFFFFFKLWSSWQLANFIVWLAKQACYLLKELDKLMLWSSNESNSVYSQSFTCLGTRTLLACRCLQMSAE